MGERATLPDWPRRMRAQQAADYFGVSVSKFLRGVASGKYPKGRRDGGNMLWDKVELDRWADRWAGLTVQSELKPW